MRSRCARFLGHSGLTISARTGPRSSLSTWRTKRATSAEKPSSLRSSSAGLSTFRRISSRRNFGGSTPSSCVMTLRLVSSPAQTRPRANTSRDFRSRFVICFVSAQPHISGARHQQEVTLSESFRVLASGVTGAGSSSCRSAASSKPCTERDMPKSQMATRSVQNGRGPKSTSRLSGLRSRWMMSALWSACRPRSTWKMTRRAGSSASRRCFTRSRLCGKNSRTVQTSAPPRNGRTRNASSICTTQQAPFSTFRMLVSRSTGTTSFAASPSSCRLRAKSCPSLVRRTLRTRPKLPLPSCCTSVPGSM
mmetsp:Transcript_10132/g.27566  ORF Transcript_10132/g.27566 Transcript_10132/m.27566 type:complete len:307 (+) Transcript_10132:275-1195(+)